MAEQIQTKYLFKKKFKQNIAHILIVRLVKFMIC